jgi:hypothetical protein
MRAARAVRSLGHAARGDGKFSDDGRGASSTRSWGSKGAEPIPFSGANSTFSSPCGANSGRARFAVRPSRAAAKRPQRKRPTTGSRGPAFARRSTRRASTQRLPAAAAGTGKASTEPDARPSRSEGRKNKCRTVIQACQEIVGNCRSTSRRGTTGSRTAARTGARSTPSSSWPR